MQTLHLAINESDIEQILRVHSQNSANALLPWDRCRVGTIEIKCRFLNSKDELIDEFIVDGALVPITLQKNLSADEVLAARTQRTFYYLNGLLRALSTLRQRQKRFFGPLKIVTDKNYLYSNATVARIARWKKRGFIGTQGQRIQLATLWKLLYDWMTAPFGFNQGIFLIGEKDLEMLNEQQEKEEEQET